MIAMVVVLMAVKQQYIMKDLHSDCCLEKKSFLKISNQYNDVYQKGYHFEEKRNDSHFRKYSIVFLIKLLSQLVILFRKWKLE